MKVKILDPRVREWGFPYYGSERAAGLDLYACLDHPLGLNRGQPAALIPTGIAIHIDNSEWCALILPRSGLGHYEGLIMGNGTGLIDADYQGEVMVSAWNRNQRHQDIIQQGITVNPGDRIAQLIMVRTGRPAFEIVEDFAHLTARGYGGFGSTGLADATPRNRRPEGERHGV